MIYKDYNLETYSVFLFKMLHCLVKFLQSSVSEIICIPLYMNFSESEHNKTLILSYVVLSQIVSTYKIKSAPAFVITEIVARNHAPIRETLLASGKINPFWKSQEKMKKCTLKPILYKTKRNKLIDTVPGCPNSFPIKFKYPSPPNPIVISLIILCKAIPLSIRGVDGLSTAIKSYISWKRTNIIHITCKI